jgi:hypothetical protein
MTEELGGDLIAEPPGEPVLHSLAEFGELIVGACDRVGARSIVEVGCEWGLTTSLLAEWARSNAALLHCVEPYPTPEFRRVVDRHPATRLVDMPSPDALVSVPAGDIYLLDGDHNYWTVSRELELIDEAATRSQRSPVLFLHDSGWPWGRRDIYYDPKRLPPDAVHPYTYDQGVVPDSVEVREGGFRSGGLYAIARHEGGPSNGVQSAVDDFLAHRPRYHSWFIPSVFGVSVLVPHDQTWSASVAELVEQWASHPLLARLERNRVELFLRVLELLETVQREQQERSLLEARLDATDRELTSARQRLHRVERELDQLASSRWVRTLAAVEAPVRRMRPGLGSVRDRLLGVGNTAREEPSEDATAP